MIHKHVTHMYELRLETDVRMHVHVQVDGRIAHSFNTINTSHINASLKNCIMHVSMQTVMHILNAHIKLATIFILIIRNCIYAKLAVCVCVCVCMKTYCRKK